mmetsp:Transcript_3499/g.8336  ORF Transcript_3499/g.8336 Transcript_3499/m.8336 type:complete len:185 (-) Transcript_3499:277-831(-)
MSYQGLAKPAPYVGTAKAQAADVSKSVKVEAAEVVEEPNIDAAPVVSGAVVGDDLKFAPKAVPEKASVLSVAELKKQGSEFESEAAVIKGRATKDILKRCLPFFYDERDFLAFGEVRRYIFVRGHCIFVYGQKNGSEPAVRHRDTETQSRDREPSETRQVQLYHIAAGRYKYIRFLFHNNFIEG